MRQRSLHWITVAALIVTTPVATAAEIVRLDRRVAPAFEAVELHLDAKRTDYTGSVRIELRVSEPVTTFNFHAEEMKLDRVRMSGEGGDVDLATESGEQGLVTATAGRELAPGNYTLAIDFSKEYNTKAVGLYRMEKDGQGYLFTQFEAIDARKAFPCWDEPCFKNPFQLTIHVPEDQEAVTNTRVESESRSDGIKKIVYARTKPLPSYLIAIAAGPLESVEIPGLSVPGRIYTVRGQKHLTGLAAEVTPPILRALEDYFGSPYPFDKLDYIAIPEYWPGAMENPGAVTWADRFLLIDPKAASVSQKRLLVRVAAHELAHMWFGDLVTMAWWDDLWLNESFADWLGDKIANQLYPEYDIMMTEMEDVRGLMNGDARPSSTPVRKPIKSLSDMLTDVGLAYGKGKTVLAMVEQYVGPDMFRQGVIDYIEAHSWGNAVADDLIRAVSRAAGQDLRPIFSSFLDQPGYPMLAVDVQSGGKVKVSQRRFLNYLVEAENLQWTVPVRLKYSDGERTHVQTFLLEKQSAEITVGDKVEWAMPDAGGFGYYRWSAPRATLMRLLEEPAETLSERERAAFIANMKALLDAGEVSGGDYLAALSAYATLADPGVVGALMSDLASVQMAFVTDDLSDDFASYVRAVLQPALERYGLEKADGEPERVTLLRPNIVSWLGDQGRDRRLRAHCRELAEKYVADPSSIDPALASVALRVGAIDGTREDFERYKTMFESTQVPADRARFLRALGSFRDPALQDAALQYVLEGQVRPNEIFPMVSRISRTEAGRQRAYKWLTGNYDEIVSRFPPEFAAFMPYFASGCSSERLESAKAFFGDPARSAPGAERTMNKVADQVNDCVTLRKREGQAVAEYLSRVAAGEGRGAGGLR